MCSKLIGVAAGAVLVAGCQTAPLPQAGSLDAGHGEVTKYNVAVQTIDPDPVYPAGGAQPGDNGQKAADATKRYRTDETRARHKEESGRGASGSAGGSSGGSGPR